MAAVKSVEAFINRVMQIAPADDEVLFYRGHADRTHKIIPSLLRNKALEAKEHELLREILSIHPSEFHHDVATFDKLVRVQHYSLPTRLLDVTSNPLVALFFATRELQNTGGEVIALRVKKSLVKYFDSDTVSCIANLSNLKKDEKGDINFKKAGKEFNAQRPIDRLVQFIRQEKPHFREEIIPHDLRSVLCVIPKKSNNRIIAQSGAFLLFGLVDSLDAAPVAGIAVERISVNAYHKGNILRELDRIAINESSMFPEIDKAAQYISAKV